MEKETEKQVFTVCHNNVLIDIKANDFEIDPANDYELWFTEDDGKEIVATFREWSWFANTNNTDFRGIHNPYHQTNTEQKAD
jgi:hypothetical protein